MTASIPPDGRVLPTVFGIIATSVIAGVLVTASLTPMIAVSSVAAQGAIGIFNNLPSYISLGELPGPNTIYAEDNGAPVAVATVFDENRQQVPWDQISQAVKDATVDGEDRRFYSHGGVDVTGIIRAALSGVIGSSSTQQGASTIAQQLVKNLSIQEALQLPTVKQQQAGIQAADAFTLARKLKEAKLAVSLEKKYTKQQILLSYMNVAPFGGTTYGIQAAAQRYYGEDASKLTVVQAATLIAIVQSPNVRAPVNTAGYAANKVRRNDILQQMYIAQSITQKQLTAALNTPDSAKTIKNIPPTEGCTSAVDDAQFWCEYVQTLVPSLTSLGSTTAEREANWKVGGYKIYTSLDVNLQAQAQAVENEWVPATLPTMDIGGATDSVEVGTGRILVMVENRAFNESATGGGPGTTAINYNVDSQNDGSSYGFQGASTYKPFTLMSWLQDGHGLKDVLNATPNPNLNLANFKDSCEPGGQWSGTYGKYTNDENETGPYTVLKATAESINGVFLDMGEQVDQCATRNNATAFGVHTGSGQPLGHQPSAILGTNSVAPLTMAAAYAGIANGGVFCKPTAIDSIVAPDGKKLAGQPQSCSVALDPQIDAAVGYAMEGVFNGGTAAAARPAGASVLGKTGTSNHSWQTWTVGSTTKVSTAVWIGNATGNAVTTATRPPRACPGTGDQVATLRNCVFKQTMTAVDAEYPPGTFPPAPSQYLNGSTTALADYSGQTITAATAELQALGFTVTVAPGTVQSDEPTGTVAYTNPAAGTPISDGYDITLYTSDGSLAVTVPNVAGDSFSQASSAIANAGFTPPAAQGCVVATTSSQLGNAVSTDPAQGTSQRPATVVTVNVGETSCP
ncbi:MAG TPA: transglycosylase domain-containing protein [Galbitalea sp.]|nr:transglycosylase domain-containing protein [Galbitalea sp.]